MGSLVTALASYLDSKSRGGIWYIRIDDIDPPRAKPGAITSILRSLDAHALQGDREIDWQSAHNHRYQMALKHLQKQVFYCSCTRKQLADQKVYPGTCRNCTKPHAGTATRLAVNNRTIVIDDAVAGELTCNLQQDFGDFILQRKDGLWSYNFATAVDDGLDATHVLRGQDLLHVTPQQAYLIQQLRHHMQGMKLPNYCHIPVLCFADGVKLSKQTHAPSLDDSRADKNLRAALFYLGLAPPQQDHWSTQQWLAWALERWDIKRVPERLPVYDSSL